MDCGVWEQWFCDMLEVRKNGCHVIAILMPEPFNGVLGVVQCQRGRCGACMPVVAGDGESEPGEQIEDFMFGHNCNPNRFPINH